jgi:hypothetical protein
LHDRLLSEIAGLQSQDRATSWARQSLPAKNRLATSDAKLVEDAFEHKLSEFSPSESDGSLERSSSVSSIPGSDAASQTIGASNSADWHRSNEIDKSVLAVSAPRRYRNKEHLRFVARQPCLLCARVPSRGKGMASAIPSGQRHFPRGRST